MFDIFRNRVFIQAGQAVKSHLQWVKESSYTHYYRALIAGFLIANEEAKKAQYKEAIKEMKTYTRHLEVDDEISLRPAFNPIPIYLWLRFFKRQESMFSNPAGILYILPILKITAWITRVLIYFGAHLPAMMWVFSFFHITGISILTAFTLPMAILTGMAWYRALFIPSKPTDTSRIAIWEGVLFVGVAVGTYFFPPLLAIVSAVFTAVFFFQRYTQISEFNTILTAYVTGNKTDKQPKPFLPDWITGLNGEDTLEDMHWLSKRSRQRFQLGVLYFFAASAWVLLRPLSLPSLFAAMPIFTGIYIGIIAIVALCAIVLPWRHAVFPPVSWSANNPNQHRLAASVVENITEGREGSLEQFKELTRHDPITPQRVG